MEIEYRDNHKDKVIDQIERFIISSFPNSLDYFVSLAKNKKKKCFVISYPETKSSEILNCLKWLKTDNSEITLHNYLFNACRHVVDVVEYFSKSKTIKFDQWDFEKWSGTSKINFNSVDIKHISFTNCKFRDTEILKQVIVNSRLIETLDNIAFYDCEGVEKIRKLMKEYNDNTGIKNYKIEE